MNSTRWSRLRRKVFRTDYEIDIELAQSAGLDTGGIYNGIKDPGNQLIYRYICEFVKAALLVGNTRPVEKIKILDWGGGKGYATYFLSRMGFDVVCFEMNNFQHRKIWQKHNLNVLLSDGPNLPFESKTFDAIIGLGVLEHVPYDYDALKELNRTLKDDGMLFIFNLPNKRGYINHIWHMKKMYYHDRTYSIQESKMLLKRSGFKFVGKPWYRQLFPKRLVHFSNFRLAEAIDLFLTNNTPLKYFATDIEFVAKKQEAYTSEH